MYKYIQSINALAETAMKNKKIKIKKGKLLEKEMLCDYFLNVSNLLNSHYQQLPTYMSILKASSVNHLELNYVQQKDLHNI